jgi:hypothetical protein
LFGGVGQHSRSSLYSFRSLDAAIVKALQHPDVTTASASLYLVPVFGMFSGGCTAGRATEYSGKRGASNRSGRRNSDHEI